MEKEYSQGDVVWYITQFNGNHLAIKCKIICVDDYFRKQDPNAYLFYDLDIAVGHFVAAYDLYDTEEEAIERMREIKNEQPKKQFKKITLEEQQEHVKDFIKSTWDHLDEDPNFYKETVDNQYFTLNDI